MIIENWFKLKESAMVSKYFLFLKTKPWYVRRGSRWTVGYDIGWLVWSLLDGPNACLTTKNKILLWYYASDPIKKDSNFDTQNSTAIINFSSGFLIKYNWRPWCFVVDKVSAHVFIPVPHRIMFGYYFEKKIKNNKEIRDKIKRKTRIK